MRNTRARLTLAAAALLLLTGCSEDAPDDTTAEDPAPVSTELSDADGQPCPEQLPAESKPSEKVPDGAPTLPEPDEVWVCQYAIGDDAWTLADGPEPVSGDDLAPLTEVLGGLTPADPQRACTMDLGPRQLVVLSDDGDLTGVEVDEYGCRDVRLTDNPHQTPAGADGQDEFSGGAFAGGVELLAALGD